MNGVWAYSFCGEEYSYLYDTKEDAIKDATIEAKESGYWKFFIGKTTEPTIPSIDVVCLLENLALEAIQDLSDGVGDEYLDNVTKEHGEELEEQLNEVLHKWLEKYGYKPDWYVIKNEDIEEIYLKGGK